MNKFNNPRLTNTTVSGTGVKHPMRPHVILGDPENGFIRGDLLDANAVIKLIKNAARATGVLEELEQSDWINYKAPTEDPADVLQNGQVGFREKDGRHYLLYRLSDANWGVVVKEGSSEYLLYIANDAAIGQTVGEAFAAGNVIRDTTAYGDSDTYDLTDVKDIVIRNMTVELASSQQ